MIKLLTIILVAMISLSTACSPIEESSKTGKEENQSESRIEEIDGVQMLLDAKAKLEALDGFYTVTEGATVSVGISQSILAKRIVSEGAVFKQSVSYSFMIKTASQTLAKDGKYFLKKSERVNSLTDIVWQKAVSELTREQYLEKFGSVNRGLSNFIITEQTIKSAEVISEEDFFAVTVILDCQTSTEYIAREMKFNSGSSELPTFQSVTLTAQIYKNGTIKSIRYQHEYKIKMPVLGKVSCKEDTTESFYELTDDEQISQYF